MKTYIKFILFFIVHSYYVHSQSVSTSPYSVYGLGSLYDSDFGSIAAMGSTGIALPSSTFINNKNPASLAFIQPNGFFFDIGAKSIFSTYQNQEKKENTKNFQFSHLAFAFPISSKSGASLSLKPYSSSSYIISDYKLLIDNSNEYYNLDAISKGGLSNLDISYGYKISKKMTLGLASSIYFGNIEDTRSLIVANSLTEINKISSYSGIRFTIANQIKIDSTFTLGIVIKTPSQINATNTQTIKSVNGTETEVIAEDIESKGTNYFLPFEMGIGINKLFKNNISLVLDYEKSLWKKTNQSNIYGEYTDQDKLSLGLSYFKNKRSIKYIDRIRYFSGISYDSGFLLVGKERVNNIAFSFGVGIPLEQRNSMLNISYSYGIKGRITNDLIKENYHKIGVNLSLEAIWFVKRKYE